MMSTQDLFSRFHQRVTTVGGEAYLVEDMAQAARIIATHSALSAGTILVPPHFEQRPVGRAILPQLREQGISMQEAGSPAEVADAPAGLTAAELAIAETGSVLLAENALEARVVSMLTLTHFVLVSADKLVPMLDDAVPLLQQFATMGTDQRHYMSFVTGPSRTADIERTLTIGVQGPRELCVIVVRSMDEIGVTPTNGRPPTTADGRPPTDDHQPPPMGDHKGPPASTSPPPPLLYAGALVSRCIVGAVRVEMRGGDPCGRPFGERFLR